ncbi:MAG: NYN domain-containing protein [Planctomycetales bacterium]
MARFLIIDGYNLINAVGLIPEGVGPGTLEQSRQALLNFLAETLAGETLTNTTVVFDAGEDAPKGLPREIRHRGIQVFFASNYDDADELIEELIQANSAPRRLTVVSSDHRLQRAARRRRAQAIDSDRWYSELIQQRHVKRTHPSRTEKPAQPQSEKEINYWLEKFQPGATDQDLQSDSNPFPPGYGEDLSEDDL